MSESEIIAGTLTEIAGADTHIQQCVRGCYRLSYLAGWWERKVTGFNISLDEVIVSLPIEALIPEKIALIHSEISEALEGFRKSKMDEHLPQRKSIEVELADACIRIFDLAGALNLDLGGAIVEKLVYNVNRPDHKREARAAEGGKKF